ncbi:hypothetical protein [Listeria booriae]|uniref:hypothetical protein n=1 Tax=Listeria booriae TaxID=1552123 RepID=UPI00162A3697|nr:hypothetical protein [Listeria booriae]MBC1513020.1 hypothetical protein [Listeria booriae]MBC6151963.1 hypothetical protein [Listeria booriae]MBC6306149.1 hypothetical protein [Listeria booriae]
MKRSIFMVALMAIILTACAPTETGTPRIASLGSHQDVPTTEMQDISADDYLKQYDALLITKDYIETSDQQLKKQLNKLDMPILFSDFDAKSAPAFLTTDLPLADIDMPERGEIQMMHKGAAVFAILDTSKEALHELYEKIAGISK